MQDASRFELAVRMPFQGDLLGPGRTAEDQKRIPLDPLLASQMQPTGNTPLDNQLFVLHNQSP